MAAMVKSEPLESNKEHLHSFHFKLFNEEQYQITCKSLGSVLQTLESSPKFRELKTKSEKKKEKKKEKETMRTQDLVIQTIKGTKPIATHFPCHLIENGQKLTISTIVNDSGEATTEPTQIYKENEQYVIFYIESKGGKNTKTKQLLKNKNLDHFSPLCIYAISGETVETALKRDGRFHNDVFTQTCTLVVKESDPTQCVEMNVLVDNLNKQTFKLTLERKNNTQAATAGSSLKEKDKANSNQPPMSNTSTETSAAGPSPKTQKHQLQGPPPQTQKHLFTGPDPADVLKILRHQFADLVKQMMRRYQKTNYSSLLNHISAEFGKSRQGFSEVYTAKELMKLSDSVCMINVDRVGQGTGFLLFDNYILTNAHLFSKDGTYFVDGDFQILHKVTATFNYENPNGSDCKRIEVKPKAIDIQWGDDHYKRHVDFAVLELTLPIVDTASLLCKSSPDSKNGGVCLIGHPGGGVKRTDTTNIIERELRGKAFQRETGKNDRMDILINNSIETHKQKYDMLMKPDSTEVTYDTCLFHGASGSPVFNESCQLIAMHTGGFPYEDEGTKSVIEYAIPLFTILEDFLINMIDRNNVEILTKFTKEALNYNNLFISEFISHMVMKWKPSLSAALTEVRETVKESKAHQRLHENLQTPIILEKEAVLKNMQMSGNEALKVFMSKNDFLIDEPMDES